MQKGMGDPEANEVHHAPNPSPGYARSCTSCPENVRFSHPPPITAFQVARMNPASAPHHYGPPVPPWRDAVSTWGLSVFLSGLSVYCLWAYATGTFTVFDSASLIVHEAGHFFFRPFGWTLHLLGGSLFQLILPALFVGSFARRGYRPGIQVALTWLGQNALNVSTYAADSRERALPLITGDVSSHDWWQLLRAADWLVYDDVIGHAFLVVAVLAFATAFLTPRFVP